MLLKISLRDDLQWCFVKFFGSRKMLDIFAICKAMASMEMTLLPVAILFLKVFSSAGTSSNYLRCDKIKMVKCLTGLWSGPCSPCP